MSEHDAHLNDDNISSQNFEKPETFIRMVEAMIFASAEPVTLKALEEHLPAKTDVMFVINVLQKEYSKRGVNLVQVGNAYAFRTAPDLGFLLSREEEAPRKLSRAAMEVLAIIAYHQPMTRAELEEVRGVETSKGTLDVLMETGWVKIRGRRKVPGRPVTYGTTQDFLDYFALSDISDLPGLEELKGSGLLSNRLPVSFRVPTPTVLPDMLSDDEEVFDDIDLEQLGLLPPRD